ncbi:hypothetical protein K437DRAFT_55705 [Tilletiaria anomala UBC 951]|uniref:Uncharacterized protein n=1 Tax=Tilletiaria anomala (strain ATCC 24038 / CBS 436.72 / UBC 951) TaxID=1037660 RepID=A0A066WJX8_TILAU|nr:uncharacterized protein K437DRAFT_55705 [Tilletiaria anomala UBC 951]KDN51319.1 hypothetical protein K437DRAFT_55705 [Tilletiaria anomala UBC 951]
MELDFKPIPAHQSPSYKRWKYQSRGVTSKTCSESSMPRLHTKPSFTRWKTSSSSGHWTRESCRRRTNRRLRGHARSSKYILDSHVPNLTGYQLYGGSQPPTARSKDDWVASLPAPRRRLPHQRGCCQDIRPQGAGKQRHLHAPHVLQHLARISTC